MSVDPKELPAREPLARSVLRAALVAALGGATLGLAESAKVLLVADARYVQWACKLVASAGAGYALLGALTALPCALLAHLLAGRPRHRVAPPSVAAGLGVILALALFAGLGAISIEALLPTALAATAIFLALRELLAWWPFATRTSTWWGLVGVLTSLCIALAALGWARGPAAWIALILALANLVVALRAFFGRNAPQAATIGVIALVVLAAGSRPDRRIPEHSGAGQTDVLLISVDTLRADHLGCYGAADAHTPVIDALAAEGVLFEQTTAQANTTGPSHTTILTGLYPAEHGALSNSVKLSNRVRTLSDVLERTHSTAAFVSGFTLVDEACGLASRFDWYDDQMLAWSWLPRIAERLHLVQALIRIAERRGLEVRRGDRPAVETIDSAIDWYESRGDEPLFAWVHLYDPHAPYQPPREYAALHGADEVRGWNWYAKSTEERESLVGDRGAVEHMQALYAGEVSYADAQIGRLLDALRANGRYERTLIVLTSDHGEGLGSHGYWFDHGTYLYDEELHVPLILRFPGAAHAGSRITQQVRLLDLAPTVLETLGLQGELATTGVSLLTLANGLPDATERPSYAISDIDGFVSGFEMAGRRMALRAHDHKLVWSSSHWIDSTRVPEREEFYSLARDPDEQVDLRAESQVPAAPFDDLQRQLGVWRESTAEQRAERSTDEDVLEQLRKLGYL